MSRQYSVLPAEKQKVVFQGILVVFFMLAFLAYPLAKGLGHNLGYGDSQNITAEAELLRAKAEMYQGLSTFTSALPETLIELGLSSMQFAIAVAIVLIAFGALIVMMSITYHIVVSARIKEYKELDVIQLSSANPSIITPDRLPGVAGRRKSSDRVSRGSSKPGTSGDAESGGNSEASDLLRNLGFGSRDSGS